MTLAYLDNSSQDLPPIVLLHAFPLNRNMWKHQITGLDGRFYVIAPDLPGFGDSPVLEGNPSLSAMAAHVLALLDSLHIPHAIFGGCSMGGYLLFQLLKDAPDRVTGLILCDTKAAADTEETRQNRYQSIQTVKEKGLVPLMETMLPKLTSPKTQALNKELMGELKFSILGNPAEGICYAQEAMANRSDFSNMITTLRIPALLFFGRDDVFTPPAIGAELHKDLAGSSLEIIEDAGHLPPLEQPNIINQKIIDFFG